MKLTAVTAALILALTPADCYQTPSYDGSLMKRQVLSRRAPMHGMRRIAAGQGAPRNRPSQPRYESDGDSDSSAEGRSSSKVKATGKGPASVSWGKTGEDKPMQPLQYGQNEPFKHSVRGDATGYPEMKVKTRPGNPPGKAKMVMRGGYDVHGRVDTNAGGHGTLQDFRVGNNDDPTHVPPGRVEPFVAGGLYADATAAPPRLKTTMQGAGILKGMASD